MAEPNAELTEKLKALANNPNGSATASFTAPTTDNSNPNTVGEPSLPTVGAVSIDPTLPEKVAEKPTIKEDENPQMANLIKLAEQSNTKLTERQLLDNQLDKAHKVVVHVDQSAKVLQILKDHGMDSQQAEHALKRLLTEL